MKTTLRNSLVAILPALLIGLIVLGATPVPTTAHSASDAPALSPALSDAKTLGIDGMHSFLTFKVMHNGVSDAWGRFNKFSGEIVMDDDTPANNSVTFEIETESVDTGNEKRDGHLRSPDFFNAVEFPTIRFESETVKLSSENTYEVSGKLTMHGETKPLSMTVMRAEAEGRRGSIYGFASTFTLKRSEFGMDYGLSQGLLGDEVTMMLSLEAAER